MTIYLIGFMGCGKTYVGQILARKLGYFFIDMDSCIEAESGKIIADIFKTEGEDHFRELEKNILHKISRENTVVSTGGGTPCFYDNMDFMKKNGLTVFLNPSIEIIVERLKNEKDKRPLIAHISDEELNNYAYKLYLKRLPFYEKADLSIEAENEEDILNVILSLVKQLKGMF
jgi:shikimate kinase